MTQNGTPRRTLILAASVEAGRPASDSTPGEVDILVVPSMFGTEVSIIDLDDLAANEDEMIAAARAHPLPGDPDWSDGLTPAALAQRIDAERRDIQRRVMDDIATRRIDDLYLADKTFRHPTEINRRPTVALDRPDELALIDSAMRRIDKLLPSCDRCVRLRPVEADDEMITR
jgi:hypothetical protein